ISGSEHLLLSLANSQPILTTQQRGIMRLSAPSRGARAECFTMDFELLRDEPSILALARASASAKRPRKAISIETPFNTSAHADLNAGSSSFLRFPVDDRLERAARTWVDLEYTEQAAQAL